MSLPEKFARRWWLITGRIRWETKFKEWEAEWHLSASKAERWLEVMKIPLVNPGQPFSEWLIQVTGDNKITRVNALVVSPPHNHKG
jgi:hypothetical protein